MAVTGLEAAEAYAGPHRYQIAVGRYGVGSRGDLALVAGVDQQVDAEDVAGNEFARIVVFARLVVCVFTRYQTDVDVLVAALFGGCRSGNRGDLIHVDPAQTYDVDLRLREAAGLLDVVQIEVEVAGQRRRTVVVVIFRLILQVDVHVLYTALDLVTGLGFEIQVNIVVAVAQIGNRDRTLGAVGVVGRL